MGSATSFEWRRGPGENLTLTPVGLNWSSNTASRAVLSKATGGASKLVVLAPGDWTSIITEGDLKTKVEAGSDLASYGVPIATSNQNVILGTKVGSVYYLIRITETAFDEGHTNIHSMTGQIKTNAN